MPSLQLALLSFCAVPDETALSGKSLQCNNPKTKEPKLSAAKRIVPEWSRYDSEIKQLLKQVKGQKESTKSSAPQTQCTGEPDLTSPPFMTKML